MLKLRFGILSLIVFCFNFAQAQNNKIDAQLQQIWVEKSAADCFIVMAVQPNFSAARNIQDKTAKGFFVLNESLKAQATPQNVSTYLNTQNVSFDRFWIVNAFRATLTKAQALEISAMPEVQSVIENASYFKSVTIEDLPQPLQKESTVEAYKNWGIDKINAPAVWALGYKGQGVIVGGQDTGYDLSHPAINDRYRGKNEGTYTHDYNWHDAIRERNPNNKDDENPCGYNTAQPCDDDKHGTHTMGTILGTEHITNTEIGIAPQARWIAARNMERGWGLLSSYIECFQWFAAPTNLQNESPDPSKAPHVIANSWGCVKEEGCNASNFPVMELAVNAVRAAGIVVVVSNGNEGPNCNTTKNPAAFFKSSFSIGATNTDDKLANFSSKGPGTYDSTASMKPDVSAPGVSIYSSVPGEGYANLSGTSMAGPQVAGLVALIISANPTLAGNVDSIENIIKSTCLPIKADLACGGINNNTVPNYWYGWGRVDALAAVNKALGTSTGVKNNSALNVYIGPNPSRGNIIVRGLTERAILSIYSADGRLEWQQNVNSGDENLQLNLPNGVYEYQIKNNSGFKSGKLVIL